VGRSASAARRGRTLRSAYEENQIHQDTDLYQGKAENDDWTTAMNDYVTAGEDYSDENINSQDDNPTQASQEIAAGNSALAS
jgi:hypothetical protein